MPSSVGSFGSRHDDNVDNTSHRAIVRGESTRQSQYGTGNFENWLMMQTLSRVISEDEAASFRTAAGLGPTGSSPPPTTG